MARACNLLDAELALDRVEAEIAVELPAHVRAFARAYAVGAPEPAAPEVLGRARTLEVAELARAHPVLADRAVALLRLAAPLAIERDPRVAVARAAPARTWEAYRALAAARERVARERFGRGHRALVHALAGVGAVGAPAKAPVVDGWTVEDGRALDPDAAWRALARRFALASAPTIVRAGGVRPRAFVVAPGREVVVVVPARLATPAARFAALHELGHAVGALASRVALPRAVDEAIASHVARVALEPPTAHEPLAAPARARRLAIAHELDGLEADPTAPTTLAAPPWALWHDPQAQAAYVAAEAIADTFTDAPIAPQLAAAIARADRAFA